MNVLFLDAYFEPETIAYTHLEKDLLNGLIAEGHKVHVICPIPTRGISDEVRIEYKKIRTEFKYNGKVIIERFWAPREGKNPILRAFRYLWCNLRMYQMAVKQDNVDLVFSNSTPPTQGVLCCKVVKKLKKKYGTKIPFIYNLQDIFPDSLVNANLTKEGSLLWKIGRKLESFTYSNVDKIILISKGFKRNVLAKGVPESKIKVISNWIDLNSVYPVERNNNSLINQLELDPNKFIVVYAGNFGETQGANIVIDVAKELKEYEDIQFVIFGGGVYFEAAKQEAKKYSNIFMTGFMPQNRISEIYSLGDVSLITCKKGTGNAGLPSKTWSIMACNTPILASFDTNSDLADVLSESGAGRCIEPENVFALKDAILNMYAEKNKRVSSLREYVYNYASKDNCVVQYIDIMESVIGKNEDRHNSSIKY